ncbi:hypothetical protein [Streptomyces sp. NPDC089799]|uniref:hypothetical protein n=1 Tax=Streptomyces sp. NPDC089799 TaxID=3155066 RepID=UPI00343B2900
MSRRVSLPGADELFRTTGGMALQASSPRRGTEETSAPSASPAPSPLDGGAHTAAQDAVPAQAPGANPSREAEESRQPAVTAPRRPQEGSGPAAGAAPRRKGRGSNRRPSGRERHDEKITVYVSAEELMDLEHARLVLRGEHGLAVDRGRIVREAVAVVLADLESRGDASILVRRLRGR